jgi:hypothetical protein
LLLQLLLLVFKPITLTSGCAQISSRIELIFRFNKKPPSQGQYPVTETHVRIYILGGCQQETSPFLKNKENDNGRKQLPNMQPFSR